MDKIFELLHKVLGVWAQWLKAGVGMYLPLLSTCVIILTSIREGQENYRTTSRCEDDVPAMRRMRWMRGGTPLHVAARHKSSEAVKWLLSHGAGLDSRDAEGKTPAKVEAEKGGREIMYFLNSSGGGSGGSK